jgi:hypothetical protein
MALNPVAIDLSKVNP